MPPEQKLERLQRILELTNEDFASKAEVGRVIQSLVTFFKEYKAQVEALLSRVQSDTSNELQQSLRRALVEVNKVSDEVESFIVFQRDSNKTTADDISTLREMLFATRESIPSMPDMESVYAKLSEIEASVPKLPAPLLGEDFRNALEALNGDDRLDKSAIRGLEDLEEEIKKAKEVRVLPAPSRGFFVYVDGVKKGLINSINFKSGSNMAISHSKVNGLDTLTFTSSGGGGSVTIETPTGTVNASNTAFAVSAEPLYMIADGTTYFDGAGYTYAALTVTFDVPPSQFVRAVIG